MKPFVKKFYLVSLFFLTIFALFNFAEAKVFFIELFATKDGKITLYTSSTTPVRVHELAFIREEHRGNYQAKIFSFKNVLLDQINFSTEKFFCWDGWNFEINEPVGGCESSSVGYFGLTLPYYPNAKYVEIFNDKGEKQLTIDVSKFAVCNENGICEKGEDEKVCPQDCQKRAIPTPPEAYQVPSKKPFKKLFTVLGWLVILGFVIFLIIKIIKWKKSKDEFSDF
jgi:hypothetical protein